MTLDQLITEIMQEPFQLFIHDVGTRKCRFLEPEEIVLPTDYQLIVRGQWFQQYPMQSVMRSIMTGNLPFVKEGGRQERVAKFLLEHPQNYHRGRSAWVIASLACNDYAGVLPLTEEHGMEVRLRPSHCYIRIVE